MSEEEIIKILKEINVVDFFNTYTDNTTDFSEPRKYCDAIEGILDLYNKEKEKNKELEEKLQQYKKIEEIVNTITDDDIRNAIKNAEKDYILKSKVKEKIDFLKEVLAFAETGRDEKATIQANLLKNIIIEMEKLLED